MKTLQVESFQDLTNLAIALSTTVNARLMSPEEATGMWRKNLVDTGLKQAPSKPLTGTVGKTGGTKKVTKATQEVQPKE